MVDKEEDVIIKYEFKDKYPENYFDIVEVDYLDYLPKLFKDKFVKYLNKISKNDVVEHKLEIIK